MSRDPGPMSMVGPLAMLATTIFRFLESHVKYKCMCGPQGVTIHEISRNNLKTRAAMCCETRTSMADRNMRKGLAIYEPGHIQDSNK